MKANESLEIQVEIRNNGGQTQNEPVQLYVSKTDADFKTPLYALKSIQNVAIKSNESEIMTFNLTKQFLEQIDNDGEKMLPEGAYKIYIGSSSPSQRAVELGGLMPLELTVNLK